ncbi:hypothetical protein ACIBG0_26550 [Nocardia sp. NPDC050630]|uniref:hypothetical protein n=1 Tax=Nocardia sp. NPDC050630 TaxID=3364321 RepID=UPI0037B16916
MSIDPLVGLGTVGIGFGTVGIIALQCLASLAVFGYFRRVKSTPGFATVVAPLVAFAGLGFALYLAVEKFELLSGATNAFVNALPTLLLVTFAAGACYAAWLRTKRRAHYLRITELMTTTPQS